MARDVRRSGIAYQKLLTEDQALKKAQAATQARRQARETDSWDFGKLHPERNLPETASPMNLPDQFPNVAQGSLGAFLERQRRSSQKNRIPLNNYTSTARGGSFDAGAYTKKYGFSSLPANAKDDTPDEAKVREELLGGLAFRNKMTEYLTETDYQTKRLNELAQAGKSVGNDLTKISKESGLSVQEVLRTGRSFGGRHTPLERAKLMRNYISRERDKLRGGEQRMDELGTRLFGTNVPLGYKGPTSKGVPVTDKQLQAAAKRLNVYYPGKQLKESRAELERLQGLYPDAASDVKKDNEDRAAWVDERIERERQKNADRSNVDKTLKRARILEQGATDLDKRGDLRSFGTGPLGHAIRASLIAGMGGVETPSDETAVNPDTSTAENRRAELIRRQAAPSGVSLADQQRVRDRFVRSYNSPEATEARELKADDAAIARATKITTMMKDMSPEQRAETRKNLGDTAAGRKALAMVTIKEANLPEGITPAFVSSQVTRLMNMEAYQAQMQTYVMLYNNPDHRKYAVKPEHPYRKLNVPKGISNSDLNKMTVDEVTKLVVESHRRTARNTRASASAERLNKEKRIQDHMLRYNDQHPNATHEEIREDAIRWWEKQTGKSQNVSRKSSSRKRKYDAYWKRVSS